MKKPIKPDYLSGAAELRPFYKYAFQNPDIDRIIADRSALPLDRATLTTELERQNAHLPGATATLENIHQLKKETTFTVTTGHQLVLMGGPMFSVYKILTVIRLAESLAQRYPQHHFVPIFWMASEDHDAEEINHFHPGFDPKITYAANIQGAVGRHVLEPSIQDVIPDAWQRFYQPGTSLAEAHRQLIHHLFGKYGLVIIDGDSPVLKAQFRTVMEAELTEQSTHSLVTAVSEKLHALGYPNQVYPREINLFHLSPERRERLVKEGDTFRVLDTPISFSKEELQAALAEQPEAFSPNALLRPLYQEFILPNLAYAGGWGELAYWMQLLPVFEHFKVNYPLLIPRMNATLIPEEVLSEWETMGFQAPDFARNRHVLNDVYVAKLWNPTELAGHASAFQPLFDNLADYAAQFEPSLRRTVEGERVKHERRIKNLEKKIKRTLRSRNRKPFERIRELKAQVQPGDALQERILNFSAFELPYAGLIDLLYAHCQPLQPTHQWISLPVKNS